MWQRIKNLWYLSGLPKNSKGFPDEFERGHQAGEMHALKTKDFDERWRLKNTEKATFIPHIKQSPITKITEEKDENN